MYKLNVELKNGMKLKLEIPAELVSTLAVEYPLAVGDVNGDGQVDKNDAMAIMDHMAGTAPLDEGALKRADVNGDGKITFADVNKINLHYKNKSLLW